MKKNNQIAVLEARRRLLGLIAILLCVSLCTSFAVQIMLQNRSEAVPAETTETVTVPAETEAPQQTTAAPETIATEAPETTPETQPAETTDGTEPVSLPTEPSEESPTDDPQPSQETIPPNARPIGEDPGADPIPGDPWDKEPQPSHPGHHPWEPSEESPPLPPEEEPLPAETESASNSGTPLSSQQSLPQETAPAPQASEPQTGEALQPAAAQPSAETAVTEMTQPRETVLETAAAQPPAASEAKAEENTGEEPASTPTWLVVIRVIQILLLLALVLDIAGIVFLTHQIRQIREAPMDTIRQAPQMKSLPNEIPVGRINNIGKRKSQQDSFGSCAVGSGILAILADGMGGLSSGDLVSKKIVLTALALAPKLPQVSFDEALQKMLHSINSEVNQMLASSGQSKSGSTLVSVYVQGRRFHWISVGDSRIYLYRGGSMLQLNQEHTYEQELMARAMKGELTYQEARQDPQRHRVTSYIGMGKLKYVDASLHSIALCPGDRILLMSDGVFNTLSEEQMAQILKENQDVIQAASIMENRVLEANAHGQDNFSAMILEF